MDRFTRNLGHGKQSKIKSVVSKPEYNEGSDGDMQIYNGRLYIKDKNKWYSYSSDTIVPSSDTLLNIVDTTGTVTLTLDQSGSIVTIDQDAAYTITLPDPNIATTSGAYYRFINVDEGSNAVSIASNSTNIIDGFIADNGGASLNEAAIYNIVNNQHMTFTSASLKGDYIDLIYVDKISRWICKAFSRAENGIIQGT